MRSWRFGLLMAACLVAGCGSSGGGSPGASGASAGGSPGASGASSGGSAGASGASSGGTSGMPSASGGLCEQQFDAIEQTCPVGVASKAANVQDCLLQEREFDGVGCQSQFDAWLVCTTQPGYDCKRDTGCETTQNGYFACQSQAVQRTGCVRLGAQDTSRCTDAAKPYAFSCLSSAPASCAQVVSSGAGIWCCPQL